LSTEIVLTNILNPINDLRCDFHPEFALVLNKGKIVEFGESYKILKKYENKNAKIIDRSKFICMPGFFDMHFHWVQDDVRLMPKDSLLTWLSKYTWPYEAKFKSVDYTKKKVASFTKELIKAGTFGGACYASIHPHTVDYAMENFVGNFVVGNVLMTMNSPKYLTQTEASAIDSVSKLSLKYKNSYAMTPRFAITTSPEVMEMGANIARKNKSFIQTHLSETKDEIDFVLSLYKKMPGFENVKSYTEIYQRSKILGPKTIMGHGIYLNENELKILAKTKTVVCHCPTSNAPVSELGLGSGLFDFRKIEKNKIRWALGSDIGGGPYLSMFDVMRSFVSQNQKKKIKEATLIKALYRATLMGATILGVDKQTGNFKKNKQANFIFVDMKNVKPHDNAEVVLKKIINSLKQDRNKLDHLVRESIYLGKTIYTSISK
jgi:guanine deaminase